MADLKATQLTALATFSGDELFYVVEDDDGTPVSRKVTVEDLAIGLFNFMGIASASTTLTNHTPNNTTAEQWATEVATIAQADCPASAVVMAWLNGNVSPNVGGSPANNDRGAVQLSVSFDGGSTWTAAGVETIVTISDASSAARDYPFSACGRVTGTVTGDVKIRAMCRDGTTANHVTFENGHIGALVHPQ